MGRLYIETLRLIGNRKNYEISFKEGLNYISGPTSTGKTSILEMIDYALGSESHKSYIEIGDACSDVEIDIKIKGKKFRIKRKLFEFSLPVRVDEWNEEENNYKYLNTYEIDIPSNVNSLSAFLLNKIGLSNIKVANQSLSFRDIFKYSYLKQTEIDTEDIMSESVWYKNNKRKSTFEIIFNVYDEMLAELKASLKEKIDERDNFKIQLVGVENFIKSTDIGNVSSYRKQKIEIEQKILELNNKLVQLKKQDIEEDDSIYFLRKVIIETKREIRLLMEHEIDQNEYIKKLRLLLNQYQNDINKCQMIILGFVEINKYDFLVCPNCLKPLEKSVIESHCKICGNDIANGISDLIKIKSDMQAYKRRHTELEKHITLEDEKCERIKESIINANRRLSEKEKELSHLQQGYTNPFIEKIEFLNYEIGMYNRQLEEMDFNLKMLEEHERLRTLLKGKEDDLTGIRKNINRISKEQNDKNETVRNLSKEFNEFLKEFHFPKLDYGHIDQKNYMPYVRGRKYNDLGSLGGVTLIVIAYYMSILKMTLDTEKYNHLNLLMIDSPRKNLGADATQEEFKDEEIFNSIIRSFIKLNTEHGEELQLLVVNNGYPEFLPKESLRVNFDPNNGRIGLIDDTSK